MKKLIAGITTTALIASLSAPAFAANFGDVAGTKYEKSTALLKALKIVNGDVDGKFNPDNELTRAEFAKIAVQLDGLGAAADATGVHASPFADVQDGDWFAGYVQVAKDAGLVNGVGYGMFAPNDKVRYEEVLAVVERILGYSDKLQGNWPTKYVIKGTELKLYDNTSFGVGKNITRGDVALIVKAALNSAAVTWSSDLNQFVNTQDPTSLVPGAKYPLINKIFGNAVTTKAALTDASTLAGSNLLAGQIFLTDSVTGNATVKLAADAIVVGGATATDLVGKKVQYVFNADGNVAYLADVTDSAKVVTGTADVNSTATTVRVNGKDYTFATGATVYKNWSKAEVPSAITIAGADAVTLILDDAGNVKYAVANEVASSVIAGDIYAKTSVTDASISYTRGLTSGAYKISDATVFTLNGVAASLADIKKGDVLYATVANDNSVVRIAATRKTVTVTADSFSTDGGFLKSITAGSTTYTVLGKSSSGFNIADTTVTVGKQYTLTLDNDGYAVKVAAVDATTNDMLVTAVVSGSQYLLNNQVITAEMVKFLDAKGNTVTKFMPTGVTAASKGYTQGAYGTFVLNSDGLLDTFKAETSTHLGTTALTSSVDKTAKTVKVDGNTYYLQDNTVYYDVWDQSAATPAVDFTKSELATIDNLSDNKLVKLILDPNDASKVIAAYLEYNSGVSAQLDKISGVYVSKKTITTADGATNYVTLNVNGTNVDYKFDKTSTVPTTVAAGDLVQLSDSVTADGTFDAAAEGDVADSVYSNVYVSNAVYKNVVGGAGYVYTSNTKVYVVKYVSDGTATAYLNNRDSAIVGNLSDFTSLINHAGSNDFKFEITSTGSLVAGNAVVDAVVVYLKK